MGASARAENIKVPTITARARASRRAKGTNSLSLSAASCRPRRTRRIATFTALANVVARAIPPNDSGPIRAKIRATFRPKVPASMMMGVRVSRRAKYGGSSTNSRAKGTRPRE